MAPTVAPRHRYGDDPSPRDLAEIGVLLDRHRDRLFNIVLNIVGRGTDSDIDMPEGENGGHRAIADSSLHAVAAEVTRNAFFQVIGPSEPWGGLPSVTVMVRAVVRAALIHRRRGVVGQAATPTGNDQGAALRAECQSMAPAIGHRHPCHAALARIDERLCALLVLRDVDGMAYRQIADVMEISLADVKSGLLQARLALRRQVLTSSGTTASDP